jgi:L1 cell adhesion molecule like protein
LIGRKFDDPAVQADMKHRPFKVIQGEAARPKIQAKEMGKIKTFYPEVNSLYLD